MTTTNTRSDVHSPLNMDPEAYEYVFAYDSQQPGCLIGLLSTEQGRAFWHEISTHRANVHGHGQCDHCGARIRYIGILKHIPTGEYIEVGETCLDNRFSLQSKAEFDALRDAAALDRKAHRIRGMVADKLQDLAATQPAHVVDFIADREGANDPEGLWFVPGDIRRKFHAYGEISDRQVALIAKVLREHAERQAERAAREAADAAEVKRPVPVGQKVVVRGEVVSLQWREGFRGSVQKMLVKGDGFKLWGSVPGSANLDRGDVISFTAQVEASDDDPNFGFFKRPRGLQVLGSTVADEDEAPAEAPLAPVVPIRPDVEIPAPVIPPAAPIPVVQPAEGVCKSCRSGVHAACEAVWDDRHPHCECSCNAR